MSLIWDAIERGLNISKAEKTTTAFPERKTSSGVVFGQASPRNDKANKINRLNQLLLGLIEEEFEFSFRTQKCLSTASIRLIGQLIQMSEPELLSLKNFGKKSLDEIKDALAEMRLGLDIPLQFPPWQGDHDDRTLILLLSTQRPGGGFRADKNMMQRIGLEIEKMPYRLPVSTSVKGPNSQLVHSTAYILEQLETKYAPGRPYLIEIIQRNKGWMQRELKNASSPRRQITRDEEK